jgi:hypothetical protein
LNFTTLRDEFRRRLGVEGNLLNYLQTSVGERDVESDDVDMGDEEEVGKEEMEQVDSEDISEGEEEGD